MANNVEITVTATNKASPVFKQIEGDANGLTGKLKALGPALAGAFAGVGVASAVKSFINDAAEAEKVQAQLNATLRSTKGAAGISLDALNQMSQALQNTTTFSDEAIGGVQALLLTFTNIKANVFEETTQAVLDMSTALGQDLKASSIALGKALQDPIQGVTALRRQGVMLTDDQEELIKKLVQTGDVLGAQKIILKEIATEFGGSASAAANTFAGKIAQLNNKFGEMKEVIGKAIIDALLPALNDLSDWFTEHRADIEKFATDAVRAIADLARDFGRGLKIIIDGLDYIPNNQGRIIAAVAAIGAAMALAFGPMSLAVVGLGAIVTLLGRIGQGEGGGIKRLYESVRDQAVNENVFRGDGTQASTMGQGSFDPAKGMFGTIEAAQAKLAEKMEATGYTFDTVKEKGTKLVDTFKLMSDTLRGGIDKVSGAINGLFGRPTREMLDLDDKIARAKGLGKGVHFGSEFGAPGTSEQFVKRLEAQKQALQNENDARRRHLESLDRTILTQDELRKKSDELAKIIPSYTGQIKASADAMGISLIPGFDDLTRSAAVVRAAFVGADSLEDAAIKATNALRHLADPNNEPLNIPGRALGGLVSVGQRYIVGEQGPELFVPSTNGQIVANSGLRGMAGARAGSGGGGHSMAVTIRGNVIVNNHGANQDADGAIRALGYMIRAHARSRGIVTVS